MTALSEKKKKICAPDVLAIMLDENVTVSTGSIFLGEKIFSGKKKIRSLSYIN